jgi:hypothetical protein
MEDGAKVLELGGAWDALAGIFDACSLHSTQRIVRAGGTC